MIKSICIKKSTGFTFRLYLIIFAASLSQEKLTIPIIIKRHFRKLQFTCIPDYRLNSWQEEKLERQKMEELLHFDFSIQTQRIKVCIDDDGVLFIGVRYLQKINKYSSVT